LSGLASDRGDQSEHAESRDERSHLASLYSGPPRAVPSDCTGA
jgi:hypothetical protein